MGLNLKRGFSIGTYQVAFVTACCFVSAAFALQCYHCPYESADPGTKNPANCVGGNKGLLKECKEEVKDPRCISVAIENSPNITFRDCWRGAAIPSDLECGVMKTYNSTQEYGNTDLCVCNSDGCIPDKESSKSFSNWVHSPRYLLKFVVIVIFVLALN
ncbi:unnamed protein product [Orchesella dallaii]|uniref:Protein quiver n=1 Tax=Orchesella dallaii TaxID=48710 RepID=A0ABP1Q6A2_9HEXA